MAVYRLFRYRNQITHQQATRRTDRPSWEESCFYWCFSWFGALHVGVCANPTYWIPAAMFAHVRGCPRVFAGVREVSGMQK